MFNFFMTPQVSFSAKYFSTCCATFVFVTGSVFVQLCLSEFIGMLNVDVNLHSSCQKTFLLAIIAVVCISEFIGMLNNDVNLHSDCQKT